MTQPPNSTATDEEREKLSLIIDRVYHGIISCREGVTAILAAGFRLAPIETNTKLMQLQGVDSQVMVHARDMGKTNQPEWLWYDRETDTRSFGRWQKPIPNASEENQPAPYIRADVVLLSALPSPTPADLIQARAHWVEEGDPVCKHGKPLHQDCFACDEKPSQDAGGVPTPADAYAHRVTLPYTNWRGEHAIRTLSPLRLFWGSNEWHSEPQWLIEAWDLDIRAIRFFALSGFGIVPQRPDEVTFQARVDPWLIACFGETIARDRMERNHRFLEEALELVQSNGCTVDEAHQLVDYVFGRPAGDPAQEVGGVKVTLAALCLAHGIDMHEAAETELARVWAKVEQIRAKQAAKPKHSPLPEVARQPEEPTAKPDGVTVDDASVERAWRKIRECHGSLMFPAERPQIDKQDLRAALVAALTPAPPIEPEPRAGGPTS